MPASSPSHIDKNKIIPGDILLKAFYSLHFVDRPAQDVLIGALEQKGILMDDEHFYPFIIIENALCQMFGKAAALLFAEKLQKTLSSLMPLSEVTTSDY